MRGSGVHPLALGGVGLRAPRRKVPTGRVWGLGSGEVCGAYSYTPAWISYVHLAPERIPSPGYLGQMHSGGWS